MILLTLVVVAATAAGIEARRRRGEGAERTSKRLLTAVLWVVLPIVAFFNVAAWTSSPR